MQRFVSHLRLDYECFGTKDRTQVASMIGGSDRNIRLYIDSLKIVLWRLALDRDGLLASELLFRRMALVRTCE